ncbi:putative rapid ALkalinization Factor [Dioscorea sansibarensis]
MEDASLETMVEWPSAIYSSYPFAGETDDGDFEGDVEKSNRRALFWHHVHYYISYGALSANRVPCPPRSGRSYYTHNCYRVRGPVHPYTRGCSAITRCRRNVCSTWLVFGLYLISYMSSFKKKISFFGGLYCDFDGLNLVFLSK